MVRDFNVRFELFRPLVLSQQERSRLTGNHNYSAVVRLRPGATPQQAVAEMNVVLARFPRSTGTNGDLKASLISLHEFVTGRARLGLWMLAGAVCAVLLIVCLNLASLLMSRVASRAREAAIRTALGASRARQFRQVMTESLLLSISGGVLGVLFAGWLVRLMLASTELDIPRLSELRLDSAVLLFAFGITVLTGLLFGCLPAWRLTRHDPQDALRAGSHTLTEGRGGLRLREALISFEVGLSAALLIVAGLLTSSLTRLLRVDKGFDAAHVLTVEVGLSGSLYADPDNRERFFERLLARIAAMPGIHSAGMITQLPTRGQTWNDPIYLEGGRRHSVDNRYASPGYFRVMSIPLRSGRYFEESDRGQHVAVLSVKAAKLLWPDDPNPVGRRFIGEDDKIKTLTGIVEEVRANLHIEAPATAYYPYWQRVPGGSALVVRTTGEPTAAISAVRSAIRSEDAQIPIREIRTMDELIDGSLTERRFQMTLVLVFAASALLVACLGICGVVAHAAACRRSEIGIRMALGAQRRQVVGLVMRQGMTPVLLGLAAGIALSLLLGRAIRGLLFGIQPSDPFTIAGVGIVLLAVGLLACLIPARRAAGTDAVTALRFE